MSETRVPGISAQHAIVSDACRTNRGDEGAIDEALARLRAEAMACMPGWSQRGARFHFVLTVEAGATRRFECWREDDGDGVSLCFATVDRVAEQRTSGLLSANAVFLYAFEAGTWFEAMSEHYRRQGWKPYSVPLMPDGTPDESVHDPLPDGF
jgi:hypothetical protein